MKSIELNFVQRFKLNDLLSAQQGPLAKTLPYMRVINLIRFTEAEDNEIVRVRISETQTSFQPPTPEFGTIPVEIEDTDAAAAAELLGAHPHFTTLDHAWADPLIEALTSKK